MQEYYLIVCVEQARSFDKLFNLYIMMSISIIYPWKALLLVSNNDSGINGIQFIFIDWGMWYNERGMQILISFCLCFSFLYASWCRIWWAVSGSPFPFISFLFSSLFFVPTQVLQLSDLISTARRIHCSMYISIMPLNTQVCIRIISIVPCWHWALENRSLVNHSARYFIWF